MPSSPIRSFQKDSWGKNIGIILVVILATGILLNLFNRPLEDQRNVSVSQVVDEIGKNNVSNITVDQNDMIVTLKSDSSQKLVAQKENDASVTDTLRNFGVTEDALRNIELTIKKPSGASFWAGALLPVVLPFILLAGFLWFMMRSAQNVGNRAISFGQTTSGPVDQTKKKKTTFAQVAGNAEAKQELMEVVEFLKNPKKFQDIGARIPKGVLLVGAPGTGKTLMARAVAGEAGVPFFSISGSEFVEMFVGVGASRVRDLFMKVKRSGPAILFIDELDAVGRHRGAGLGGGHDEREQTLNQILVEMDGFEQNDKAIVIAATNRPDVLDPALLRPGRFDRQVTMDLPDIAEREAILKIHAGKVPMEKDVDLRNIGERTPGFSGAELANLINEAAIFAAREDKKKVSQRHVEESIEKVILGPEKRSRVYSKQEKELTAYHEAGHAIVAYYTPDSDPVRKISIISRGFAGGYTLKLPEEDKRLHTKTGFLSELATLMGGYTAELVQYKELTTGASNDLMKATKLARRIVTQFGMSSLGPVTYGQHDHQVFLGRDFSEGRDYSEKTASHIDDEVAAILKAAQKQAEDIITTHREKLELIAKRLIEKETIGQKEFADLMGGIDPDVAKDDAEIKPAV